MPEDEEGVWDIKRGGEAAGGAERNRGGLVRRRKGKTKGWTEQKDE